MEKNNEEEIQIQILTAAEKAYLRLKNNVSKYQKKNPEKCKEKNKRYFQNLKENNPEKYDIYLQKKKEYYHTVVKPKLQKKIENCEVIF